MLAAVPQDLLADIPEGVLGTPLVGLVDGHPVGEIEHVDFFELGGGPVFGGHHVEREPAQVGHFRIALPDAGGFKNDEVEARGLEGEDSVAHGFGRRGMGPASGHAPHEAAWAVDRIHADAVAKKGSPRLAAGGVDRKDGHRPVGKAIEHAQHPFVGQRGLAGPARSRDAEDGAFPFVRGFLNLCPDGLQRCGVSRGVEGFQKGQAASQGGGFSPEEAVGEGFAWLGEHPVGPLHHVLDHSHEAHEASVLNRIDVVDPGGMERGDFLVGDGSASAAEDGNLGASEFGESLHQESEEFHVPSLVGGKGDAVGVLFHRGFRDFLHRSVVAQVDDFGTLLLEDAPHDVDGRVVAVEERGGGDEAEAGGGGCHRLESFSMRRWMRSR